LVELGTHHGYSYFVFNQALKKLRTKCRCIAVDTWAGDEHAGYYGDEIFENVRKYNEAQFADFSELMRTTFSEALGRFEDGSIDLLHIDGRHFYDDVKQDFETWQPKLSKRAVVLLHDTNVRAHDFGVYRLWEELKTQYPHFEFLSGHGLGVLGVGEELPPAVRQLFAIAGDEKQAEIVREAYGRLGNAIVDRANLYKCIQQNGQRDIEQRNAAHEQLASEHTRLASLYDNLNENHQQLTALYDNLQQHHMRLNDMYKDLEQKFTESCAAQERSSKEHADLQATLERSREETASALTEARRLSIELEQVTAEKRSAERHTAELQLHLAELQTHTANQEMAYRALRDEFTKASGDLHALVHSKSWRITKPLRDASQHIPAVARSVTSKVLKLRLRDAFQLQRYWSLLSTSPLFDKQFYLENNPDMARSGQDATLHYLLHGGFEGRDPHPLFHSAWYLQHNADVARAKINPLVHFLLRGAKERRRPCAFFDPAFYLATNPDINADANPLLHYLNKGAAEGCDPSACFDTDWYVNQNPSLFESGLNPLIHYVRWGRFEGLRSEPSSQARSESVPPSGAKADLTSNAYAIVAPAAKTETLQVSGTSTAVSAQQGRPRIVFISGEWDTPGHKYRVENIATALPPMFFHVTVIKECELDKRVNEVTGAALVWIWRSRWSYLIGTAIEYAQQSGAQIIFDVDDLMFRPELAKIEIIDGIRSQSLTEDHVRKFYAGIQAVLEHADHCTAPTAILARELRDFAKPTTVIPNGFDTETFTKSRKAVLERQQQSLQGRDEVVRIGYAAGSRTHQRDLAVASKAISEVLGEFPNARLVLFNGPIQLDEFPELMAHEHQVEWRDLVPVSELQSEYARFDINIAPLEVGNRFCEAKSELKYFEAALVGVPTIASPTQPFANVIRTGETGFLASNHLEWVASLRQLIQNPVLRTSVAQNAYRDILWLYGPERRTLLVTKLVNQLLAPANIRSQLFSLDTRRDSTLPLPEAEASEYDVLYQSDRRGISRVSLVIPVFNYSKYLPEALESVRAQTVRDIDVIVVDDQSTDDSVIVAERWLSQHARDFNFVALLRNWKNSKLGRSRNVGVRFADTEFYLPLDPDNLLLPDCIEKSLEYLHRTGAAFAYPTIEIFGDTTGTMGDTEFDPARLQCGNYIDAMAMVRRACWMAVGGYSALDPAGWEDYDFWCKLIERGFFGVRVPEVIAKYRVHGTSMLQTLTDLPENKPRVIDDLNRRHPWLGLRTVRNEGAVSNNNGAFSKNEGAVSKAGTSRRKDVVDLDKLLPFLRCPETGEQLLKLNDSTLTTPSGRTAWPIVKGRPVFTPEGISVTVHPETHLSNTLPKETIRIIEQSPGLVLNLSAGGTAVRYPNVVELEYSIFRHTHIVGDVHRLPFQDEIFEAVVCLNAFEHYRDPNAAMNEIHRVLKPGGRFFMHTAFMQPLHEAPHHYYNCTEFGLREWLRNFDVKEVCVSDNFNPAYTVSWLASELELAFAQYVSGDAAETFRKARLGEVMNFWRNPDSRSSPIWKLFYTLPTDIQRRFAAGWQATAIKKPIMPPNLEKLEEADVIKAV
ncbi:MAG: class I SAM-dependent methyltransferase, partial [Acidobacteriaceae bacterium]|nr:class I SAM-dependent methyltransferase [Acidobacteriaceae bacterium]